MLISKQSTVLQSMSGENNEFRNVPLYPTFCFKIHYDLLIQRLFPLSSITEAKFSRRLHSIKLLESVLYSGQPYIQS